MIQKYPTLRGVVVTCCLILISFSLTAQWNPIKTYPELLLDAQFISEQTIVVAGSCGVYKTPDGGSTWTFSEQFKKIEAGGLLENLWFSASIFFDVHFIDQQTGIAAGWSLVNSCEIIIRTTDGGVSWTVVYAGQSNPDDPTQGIKSIQFPSASIGYASSFKGRILKTTDGGQTWSLLNTGIIGDVTALQFFNTLSGIALSNDRLYKTSNGGQTWIVYPKPLPTTGNTMFFVNANLGFVAINEKMIKTTDGGATWSVLPMSLNAYKIHFTDSQTGYAAGTGIYKTTDGGQLWTLQQKDAWEFRGLHALNPSLAIATTFDGKIYKTTNGGGTVIPDIKINGFTPAHGLEGTGVAIRGENLDYVHTVIIGDVPVSFTSEPGEIYFTVPAGITDDKSIVIKSMKETVSSTQKFSLIKVPSINSFTPFIGIPGASVTISGYGFNTTTSVLFNSIPAAFTVVSNTTLTAVVPEGNATGKIQVINPFGSATSYNTFTKYNVPVISSFTPTAYYRDGTITIRGSDFELGGTVKLNGTILSAWAKSPNEIIVWGLPPEATSGKFSVANAATVSYSNESFTVLEGTPSPSITGFSPMSGGIGQSVTVNGQNFYSLETVTLNGGPISFEVLSDNQFVAEIPSSAQTGKIEIYSRQGQYAVSAQNFTVQSGAATPVIEVVTPPTATVQTKVTLQGKNFYDVGEVFFDGVRAPYVFREGLTKLVTEVPTGAKTGYITVGNTTTDTFFEVIGNYCVPQRSLTAEAHIPWMVVGNILYQNNDPKDCKTFYDETAQLVEAKKGTPLALFAKPQKCGSGRYGDLLYFIYVDWNNDRDFHDADELIYQSVILVDWDVHYQPFQIPATAPATGSYRMRVYTVRASSAPGPCELFYGSGVGIDFTLKIVDQYTTTQPAFTAFHPVTTTPGATLSAEGQHLQTTQRVFVGGVNAPFSFNSQTGNLDIQIPPGTASNEVVIITQGGSLQIKDKVVIIPHPNIVEFKPELDTIGGEIALAIPYGSLSSITHAYFNGVEAEFRSSYPSLLVKVPAGATSGKISVANAFGEYYSAKDFTVITAPSVTSFFPLSAHMGENILINGHDFIAITEVSFNGKPARFTVVSPTQISAQVPYGGSHGKITVQNKKSTAVSAETFTVLPDETSATFGEIPSFNYNYHNVNGNQAVGHFDYDGDGFMDLVIGGVLDIIPSPANKITIYRNNGNGTFAETDVRMLGYDFLVGDFNRDGRDDIITKDGAGLRIYYNDSDHFKTPPYYINLLLLDDDKWDNHRPSLTKVIDYDHDGDLDIIITGWSVAWFEQNNGSFTLRYIDVPVDQGPPYLFEDFDKDGDTDILTSRNLYIHENGTFKRKDSPALPGKSTSVAVVDYNADGYPDILGGADLYNRQNLQLFKNLNGTGFQMISFGGEHETPDPLGWGDFHNSGITGFITHLWHAGDPGFSWKKFKFYYFDLLASGQPSEKESWIGYNNVVEEIHHFRIPKTFFDFENDGDIDMFTIHGVNRVWPRLFKNYTLERTGKMNKAPVPPTVLTIEKISDTEVMLKWNAGGDDLTPVPSLNYNVRVKDETTGTLTLAPATLGTPYGNAGMMQSYYLKGLTTAHIYSFEVQVIDQGYKASAFSAQKKFKLETITKPSALSATPTGMRSVKLQWNDNTTLEEGYILEYKKEATTSFSFLARVAQNTNVFNATLLDCHASYQFRVQAFNALSVSDFSDAVSATTFTVPVPAISGPASFCESETIDLIAPPGYASYHWSDSDLTQNLSVSAPGEYVLKVTDAQGCEGTNKKTVTQVPLPVVTIEVKGSTLVASGATSYEWYRNNVLLPSTGNTITPREVGVYQTKGTLQGCSDFSETVNVTVTDIDETPAFSVSVTPNPTAGLFTVRTGGIEGHLTIVNTLGREVYSTGILPSDKDIEVDIRSQTSGLYLISIQSSHKNKIYRLMLVK